MDETETSLFRLNVVKRHLAQSAKNNPNQQQRNFTYTLSNGDGVLTEQDREFYETNGYLVVRNLISPQTLDKYRKRFHKICSEKIEVPFMTVMKDVSIAKSEFVEGEKAITKIQDFCTDDELFEYCCLEEVLKYVKPIIGPNVMAVHTMLINKPPGNKINLPFYKNIKQKK